ncbi:catalase/peroxidase HPI [Arenicella sp. 4NH20-0111]|uniref:catalase/peroxidase HPI n=1 Tax=Arenicella sp. 4NH20-0111 TaxID=3127648 RepID=UPI0031098FE0
MFKKTFPVLTTIAIAAISIPQVNAAHGADKQSVSAHSSSSNVAKSNQFWWPDQLDLTSLRDQDARSNPLGQDFNYAQAFNKLDLKAVKSDVDELLTTSQDWWPADFGNYGPFFIRMSWHAAGTYRTLDGRGGGDGGQMRFNPLNSWPDNGNLDKARRLLWPIKQKYGRSISWGDLMILAGNVALENMGFKTYGFAGGRADDWEPDLVYWGPEVEMLASDRKDKNGKLKRPLGATHMGLIYVNPEGPMGKPDPVGSAKNIRVAFGRMAMNDEETVALVAGGHTFGKMHGAHKPGDCVGADPAAASLENQGLGWKNKCGKGHSEDTVTSGLEGAWTQAPTKWTTLYLSNLLNFDWVESRSPGGAIQWIPSDESLHRSVPDAHVKEKRNPPVMTTADLALKFDPEYKKIAQRFLNDPEEYRLAFAKAWYKLTHRDMGPRDRYLKNSAPKEELIWQDPISGLASKNLGKREVQALKEKVLESGLSPAELIRTAWASASSYRASDMRGGANGARVALLPQNSWEVNNPDELKRVIAELESIKTHFNEKSKRAAVSLADLIVLAGAVGVEEAAKKAGTDIDVPFTPGRGDATQEQTDLSSFALLKPSADAFRNYYNAGQSYRSPTEMMVDRADQLDLTIPEMTVLIGGLRSLGANAQGLTHGVLTDKPGTLNNDFFVNLLDMAIQWSKTDEDGVYQGRDRDTGKARFTATPVDLVFGSNSELRAIAEVYSYDNAQQKFAEDFVAAWAKVMMLDRFDLAK